MSFELCVGSDDCLGLAINFLPYFHIYTPIMNLIYEVVLFHDFLGDERCFGMQEFVGVHWSV